MKLPLKVRPGMSVDHIVDADGMLVPLSSENLQSLVALANAHATVPGPPREDGEYIVRTSAIDNNVLVKRRDGVNVIALVGIQVPDDKILCHRKHQPLEVKHG